VSLQDLPEPAVIEPLGYEPILAALVAAFRQRYPEYSALVESDPAIKLLEVAAYREMILRQRINEAAKSQLLAFAAGADLDHLAAFYGVERLPEEQDEALRQRCRARIQGFANAGGAAHYRYWALSASPGVQDVGVVSPMPGLVRVAVLVREGADAQAVLEAVSAQLAREDVRVLTDTVEVVDAQIKRVMVRATLWRLPGTLPQAIGAIAEQLRATIRQRARLGWDATRSWLMAQLHQPGIHRVELIAPAEDARCAAHEAVRLEEVELIDGGVDE